MEIKIYTSDQCGYCFAAKNWFKKNDLEFEEIDVSNVRTKTALYEELKQLNISTVPQIFVNGKHIGGYTELLASNFAKKNSKQLRLDL